VDDVLVGTETEEEHDEIVEEVLKRLVLQPNNSGCNLSLKA